MATPPFVPYMNPAILAYPPGPKSQFSDLAIATLGNIATPSDGFDAAFGVAVSALDATGKLQSAADQSLSDAATAASTIDTSEVDDLAQQIISDSANLVNLTDAQQQITASKSSPLSLPATPSNVNIPSLAPAGGTIATPSAPNPPVTGQKATTSVPSLTMPTRASARTRPPVSEARCPIWRRASSPEPLRTICVLRGGRRRMRRSMLRSFARGSSM